MYAPAVCGSSSNGASMVQWCLLLLVVLQLSVCCCYRPILIGKHKLLPKLVHRRGQPAVRHVQLKQPHVSVSSQKPFRPSKQDSDGTGALGNGFYPVLNHHGHQLHFHPQPYSYQVAHLGHPVSWHH